MQCDADAQVVSVREAHVRDVKRKATGTDPAAKRAHLSFDFLDLLISVDASLTNLNLVAEVGAEMAAA